MRQTAATNITGPVAKPARSAPAAAKAKLRRSIFLEPILSVMRPAGMAIMASMRGGMAAMMPSCWRVRLNSSRSRPKMAVWIPLKTWVRMWDTVMTVRP